MSEEQTRNGSSVHVPNKPNEVQPTERIWYYESIFGPNTRRSKSGALLSKVRISPFGSYNYLTDAFFK